MEAHHSDFSHKKVLALHLMPSSRPMWLPLKSVMMKAEESTILRGQVPQKLGEYRSIDIKEVFTKFLQGGL